MASADDPLGLLKDPIPMKKYRVTLIKTTVCEAETVVEAASPEIAELVAELQDELDWHVLDDNLTAVCTGELESVSPAA